MKKKPKKRINKSEKCVDCKKKLKFEFSYFISRFLQHFFSPINKDKHFSKNSIIIVNTTENLSFRLSPSFSAVFLLSLIYCPFCFLKCNFIKNRQQPINPQKIDICRKKNHR